MYLDPTCLRNIVIVVVPVPLGATLVQLESCGARDAEWAVHPRIVEINLSTSRSPGGRWQCAMRLAIIEIVKDGLHACVRFQICGFVSGSVA